MDFSSYNSLDDLNYAPDASGNSTSEYDSADEEPLARWRIHHSTNRPSSTGSTQNFSKDEIVRQQVANIDWGIPKDHMPTEDFSGVACMKDIHQGIMADGTPLDYLEVFMTFDIVQTIVDQTNHYACQHLTAGNIDVGPQSRLHNWKPVTINEMYKFLALIGWMVKLPCILDYWRKHKLYGLPLVRTVMPRNRFELILKLRHFSDNEQDPGDDRLYKLRTLMDKFIHNFQNAFTPGKKICIDESLIPWRDLL
ncbi:unnamed protein product [Parnassius apollo]|uniref:(apollo) hypothetical protein n=2 Tax=Parnassius apollo TaxID=110799 RepID=A0A8S3XCK4_PARAO|nr:unnamed protein product [Parnassius apollo]